MVGLLFLCLGLGRSVEIKIVPPIGPACGEGDQGGAVAGGDASQGGAADGRLQAAAGGKADARR